MDQKIKYDKGDTRLIESQCRKCIYANSESVKECVKYPVRKPLSIRRYDEKCIYRTLDESEK